MAITIETLIYNEYFQAFLIILGTIIFAKVFVFVLTNYVKKITEKTKSELDDIILQTAKNPIYLLIILAGLYFSLKFLSFFIPYTAWVDGIFFISSVLIVALMVSRIFSVFVNYWLKVQKRFEKTPQLINKIVSVVIYLIAFLMLLSYFKIEITPLVATLGLGGLAVGLALQGTLSNLFAGLHIISDRPIDVGDFIDVPDANISGYVEDIGWRSTRIRTLPNQLVIVPNSKLSENVIINNSLPEQQMKVIIQVGVAYDSDLKKVEKVTIDVAKKIMKTVPGAVKNFEPVIRYHTFGDSNINFAVVLAVEKFVNKYLLTHEFIKALKERYDKEGIEISWPVRKIYQAK